MLIKEMKDGTRGNVSLMVESATISQTKNGDDYQKITVKDTEGTKISVNFFNKGKNNVKELDIIDAVLECSNYNGSLTYIMKDFHVNKELNSLDFKPKAEINPDEVWQKIIVMIRTITNMALCKLCCKTLSNNMKDFKTAPLTASDSYSRVAGLMEATYKLMCLANTTAETMKLKKDLMLAAASVYYIGNVDMVNAEYHPTKDVALIGFDIAAHDKLVVANNQIAESERVSKEDFQIFENCLLSRWQGKPTATREAFALKMLDSIIQVDEIGKKTLESLEPGTFVDDRPFNRKWYKRETEEGVESNE